MKKALLTLGLLWIVLGAYAQQQSVFKIDTLANGEIKNLIENLRKNGQSNIIFGQTLIEGCPTDWYFAFGVGMSPQDKAAIIECYSFYDLKKIFSAECNPEVLRQYLMATQEAIRLNPSREQDYLQGELFIHLKNRDTLKMEKLLHRMISSQGSDPYQVGELNEDMGDIKKSRNEADSALYYYQRAIEIYKLKRKAYPKSRSEVEKDIRSLNKKIKLLDTTP